MKMKMITKSEDKKEKKKVSIFKSNIIIICLCFWLFFNASWRLILINFINPVFIFIFALFCLSLHGV